MAIAGTAFIHERAEVDATVSIGAGTKVWQFASVIRYAEIGEGCTIAANAVFDGSKIGDRSIVSSHCAIGPGFMIGSDVFIGPSVTFCNDRFPATNKENFHPELLTTDLITIRVKDGASIGANVVLLPGIVIGCKAMIAAHATVNCDVPDDHMFCRDGSIVKIKPEWREKRMKPASCLL
jgi:acetyltransferase-like isoleucine patch superfamily enzyme